MTSGDDTAKLDGTWQMIHGEQGGRTVPEAWSWRARLVVAAGVFTLRVGADAIRGAFRPGAALGPGWVDAVVAEGPHRGAMVLGVYDWDGCRLRLSFAAPGQGRPKDLTSADLLYVWEAITEVIRPQRPPRAG